MTDERRHLAKTAENPQNWLESALRLCAAMFELEPAMRSSMVQWTQWFEGKAPKPLDYHAVYHMLAGLAIENLCKDHIVQHLPQDEKNKLERGSLPARLDRKHNLQKLFDDVGFKPSAQDQEIIDRIQLALYWRGRYPVGKDDLAMPRSYSPFSGADDLLTRNLIRRLAKHVGFTWLANKMADR